MILLPFYPDRDCVIVEKKRSATPWRCGRSAKLSRQELNYCRKEKRSATLQKCGRSEARSTPFFPRQRGTQDCSKGTGMPVPYALMAEMPYSSK